LLQFTGYDKLSASKHAKFVLTHWVDDAAQDFRVVSFRSDA
jgi:hypothetical protein